MIVPCAVDPFHLAMIVGTVPRMNPMMQIGARHPPTMIPRIAATIALPPPDRLDLFDGTPRTALDLDWRTVAASAACCHS
jgi:hypothetical protein